MLVKNIEVISLDAYGTLLDPSEGMELAAKKYIHRNNWDSSKQLWILFFKEVNSYFKGIETGKNEKFICAKEIYKVIYYKHSFFKSLGLSPDEFVQMVSFAHSNAVIYKNVPDLVTSLRQRYRLVVLTSDADNDFLNEAVEKNGLEFDCILTSEEAKGYKAEKNSKLFNKLIEVSEVGASKILHVGDSIYDVKRSRQLGISAMLIRHDSDNKLPSEDDVATGISELCKRLL